MTTEKADLQKCLDEHRFWMQMIDYMGHPVYQDIVELEPGDNEPRCAECGKPSRWLLTYLAHLRPARCVECVKLAFAE